MHAHPRAAVQGQVAARPSALCGRVCVWVGVVCACGWEGGGNRGGVGGKGGEGCDDSAQGLSQAPSAEVQEARRRRARLEAREPGLSGRRRQKPTGALTRTVALAPRSYIRRRAAAWLPGWSGRVGARGTSGVELPSDRPAA
jgi:hypothetical protein